MPQRNDVNVLTAIAKIADEGIATIPTSWKIPFYLGTQYYLFTKEYEPATHYLGIAASRKDAPDGVYLMYSTFVAKRVPKGIHSQADYETVQKLVKVIYSNTDNETIKKIASSGLQENAINHMLERGIVAYKEKYKRYPKNAHEMEVVHFTSLPQGFLDNFEVQISLQNGNFRVVEREN